MMKCSLLFFWMAAGCASVFAGQPVDDPALALADKLLARMSLEEKVALCHGNGTMSLAANPGIGLDEEFWMSDSTQNVREELERETFASARRKDDQSTSLPSLAALAATWDPALAFQDGVVIGEEARDRGKDMILGPGVNIMRTPLCGRNFEYLGEDPFLASRMAVAYIEGVQSKDVAACVKHFALNNQELDRMNVDVEVDERTLHEIYLPAFEAAVKEAGCLTVMGAYNRFRGEFCCQNGELNWGILKGRWGFKGFVVSDWGGLHDTVKGALGGLDVEMNMGRGIRYFNAPLLEAVREGKVPEALVNDKARRVLYVMAKLKKIGGGCEGGKRAVGSRNTKEHQAFAQKVAEEAIVLLKNDAGVLPLDRGELKSVLVVGDNATRKHCWGGGSSVGKPPYEVSPLEGLTALLGRGVKVDDLPSRFTDKFTVIPGKCIETENARDASAGLALKGWRVEYFANMDLQGAPKVTGFDPVVGVKMKGMVKEMGSGGFSARWTATIKPDEAGAHVFSIRHDGRARVRVDGKVVVEDWTPGAVRSTVGQPVVFEKDKTYVVSVEYSHQAGNSEAALTWRPPSARVMSKEELTRRAKAADVVLFFTGDKHERGRAGETEGGDRPNMKLPEGDDAAIPMVLAANPRTVVINLSGAPVEMPWIGQAHTVVQYWFSGMEGGNALARVLCGEVNPAGKLPFTFPRRLEDSPAHALGAEAYNPRKVVYKEGVLVGYRWYDTKHIEPLFPFGYGLSYTQFKYSGLNVVKSQDGRTVAVRFTVENVGKRAGAEVAQVYIHQDRPGVVRPEKELKGFQKVTLQPGEKKRFEVELGPKAFAYYDPDKGAWVAPEGDYEILVGASSRDIRLECPLRLPAAAVIR